MARSGAVWVVTDTTTYPIAFFTVHHEAVTFMEENDKSKCRLFRVPVTNEYPARSHPALWSNAQEVT